MEPLVSMKMPARMGKFCSKLEVEDFCGRDAVVEQGKVGELEVVDREAVGVGCVEGEDDFVDGNVEAIGRGLFARDAWAVTEEGEREG